MPAPTCRQWSSRGLTKSRCRLVERDIPQPGKGQVLVEVLACAVCRTDLHLIDGELPDPKLPVIPGHEIVGRILTVGDGVETLQPNDRIGIAWLGYTCGICDYCVSGRENLCNSALFTGYQIDGGYATHTVADARYCFPLPENYGDAEVAPLLCAGLIGHRSLRATADAKKLGIYGFGAAAPISSHKLPFMKAAASMPSQGRVMWLLRILPDHLAVSGQTGRTCRLLNSWMRRSYSRQ